MMAVQLCTPCRERDFTICSCPLMTQPISPDEGDALKAQCVEFVREQSQGEWSEKDIQSDARKMAAFIRSLRTDHTTKDNK